VVEAIPQPYTIRSADERCSWLIWYYLKDQTWFVVRYRKNTATTVQVDNAQSPDEPIRSYPHCQKRLLPCIYLPKSIPLSP